MDKLAGFVCRRCKKNSISVLWILFIIFSYSIAVQVMHGYAIEFFSKNESPFGTPYDSWVTRWWNWNAKIPLDNQTASYAGLKDNGCLINRDGSVVMLVDTAAGGIWNQVCKISPNQGILIPIWTAECETASKGYENATFEELSKCARDFDLGVINGQVKVDGKSVALLDVVDYTTNAIGNVTEVKTNQFNFTFPPDTHLTTEKYGTFPAAAHGWFVFLKPLPLGDHTIYYQNSVQPTTLSGAGNVNAAQFTYHMKVE